MNSVTIEIKDLLTIFGYFVGFVVLLFGIIGWFFQNLHSQLKKSIETVHLDLKPLVIKVAVVEERITDIKTEQQEMHKWLNNHDTRIQHVERKVATIK